jgi:hypothetical protein
MTGEMRSFEAEFTKASRALTNASVAVFPVDPRGLMGLPEFDVTSRKPDATRPWRDTDSTLRRLAADTGGRAYVSENDILGSLRQVSDDAQTSYSLAYYPANAQFDGKYRRLEIRFKRPGLSADHRKGYYALDAEAVKRSDAKAEIREAARGALDSSLIEIDAGLAHKDGVWQLTARIDAGELMWPQGAGFEVRTTVGMFQFDAEGRELENLKDDIEFRLDPAKAGLLSQHGLSYSRKVVLNPAAVRFRMVVHSNRTDALGSLTSPIGR